MPVASTSKVTLASVGTIRSFGSDTKVIGTLTTTVASSLVTAPPSLETVTVYVPPFASWTSEISTLEPVNPSSTCPSRFHSK